jgi:hypothetical protein
VLDSLVLLSVLGIVILLTDTRLSFVCNVHSCYSSYIPDRRSHSDRICSTRGVWQFYEDILAAAMHVGGGVFSNCNVQIKIRAVMCTASDQLLRLPR